MDSKARDTIKEVLDRECYQKEADGLATYLKKHPKTETWLARMEFQEKSECEYNLDHGNACWQCHKHDDLAARIADATQETK